MTKDKTKDKGKKGGIVIKSTLADGANIFELDEPVVLSEGSRERVVLTVWVIRSTDGKEKRRLCIRKMWRQGEDDMEWKFSKAVVMLDADAVRVLIHTLKLFGPSLENYIGYETDNFNM